MTTTNRIVTQAGCRESGIQVFCLPRSMNASALMRLVEKQLKTDKTASPTAPAMFLMEVPTQYPTHVSPETIRAAIANLPEFCGNRIFKVGESWHIDYEGVAIHGITDVQGMKYLEFLLIREGDWFDVLELSRYVEPPPPIDANQTLGKMTPDQQDEERLYLQNRPDSIINRLDPQQKKSVFMKLPQKIGSPLAANSVKHYEQ